MIPIFLFDFFPLKSICSSQQKKSQIAFFVFGSSLSRLPACPKKLFSLSCYFQIYHSCPKTFFFLEKSCLTDQCTQNKGNSDSKILFGFGFSFFCAFITNCKGWNLSNRYHSYLLIKAWNTVFLDYSCTFNLFLGFFT